MKNFGRSRATDSSKNQKAILIAAEYERQLKGERA
jgi:hypothetical protein